jgi:hypothetical protein
MKNTKINGLPGFGLPSTIGEKGSSGTNIYFADIKYSTVDESIHLGQLDSSYITYEYYFGRDISSDKNIPMFNIVNKSEGELFKNGDIIMVNITRCCFFEVVIVEFTEDEQTTQYAYIKNEPKYSLTLSPIKMINFSLSASYETSGGGVIHLYPSLTTEKQNLVKYIDIEFIPSGINKTKHIKQLPSNFNGNDVSIKLNKILEQGEKTNTITINVYAICNTNTMGLAEYFIGTEKVSV